MKVLYISNYKDGTGYGHAACENILALDAAGVDVVPRAIKLNGGNAIIPERILELEKKSSRGCNICIQHVLPHLLDFRGEFEKNIAIYYSETSHFRNSGWAERLNLFDEAWVCNHDMVYAARESYVNIPLKVISIPCDTQKYEQTYQPLELPEDVDGTFKFYTIGEIIRRKNLVAALKAFHLEFDPNEDVSFIIKGAAPGCNPIESRKHLEEIVLQVKRNLKLRKIEYYKQEVFITKHLSELEIMQLHTACDCYISPSHGEAWNIPAFDAMAMGKTPILTDGGGHDMFLAKGGWNVATNLEPVFGMADDCQFSDLYVGNECWNSASILDIRRCMREAYENHEIRKNKASAGIDRAYDFSYNRVGARMREALEGNLDSWSPDGVSKTRRVHSMSFVQERSHEKSADSRSCGSVSGYNC